jgi:hypothetical protein
MAEKVRFKAPLPSVFGWLFIQMTMMLLQQFVTSMRRKCRPHAGHF